MSNRMWVDPNRWSFSLIADQHIYHAHVSNMDFTGSLFIPAELVEEVVQKVLEDRAREKIAQEKGA